MSDEKISSEGGDPPNNSNPVRPRRNRKLTGIDRRAVGELAFALYEVAAMEGPSDTKWAMLRAKLLAWRAIHL